MEPPPRPIDDPRDLDDLVHRLLRAPRIGVDTEGDGYHRYRARLCVIQLASGHESAVIDPLAPRLRLDGLTALLGPDGPEKVLHDATFDVRMLADAGLPVGRVVDTAAAAKMLGAPQGGLAALVDAHLGVHLAKGEQLADWGERPLSDTRLRYLHDDVRYLLPLAAALEARAVEAGLSDEVREESAFVVASALEPPPPPPPLWTRVKGARDLSPAAQARLRALVAAADRAAAAADVPVFRLVPPGVLVELARRRPRGRKAVQGFRGARRLSPDDVLAALDEGERMPVPVGERSLLHPEAPPPELRRERRGREKRLRTWRSAEAERRGVADQAVLPTHCLRALTLSAPATEAALAATPGLGAFRVRRYGAALLAAIRGAETG